MRPFLTAAWRHIVLANYATDPALLAAWLPDGLELDTYHGRHYVSLVGFMFEDTRLLGVPVPFHREFEEVNLRIYVRRPLPGGEWRRGVVFIGEIVPKFAVAALARTVYGEPYRTRPMLHRRQGTDGKRLVEYAWKDSARWHRLAVRADAQPHAMAEGSAEEFITEHYYGYSAGRGSVREYRVEHPRWQVYGVRSYDVDCDFALLYGEGFGFLNRATPDSVMLADGSAVAVWPHGRIGDAAPS
jgi:uncharacterized protein YqjF (DUF2071 family)